MKSEPLYAGVAKADITPQARVQLSGDVGAWRPAELIADPLYARAIVFRAGDRKLCILSLDVTIVTQEYTDRIRCGAAEKCGLQPDAVMVHATQTHSAPGLGHFMIDQDFPAMPAELDWLKGGDDAYGAFVVERAVQAIGQAHDALRPVQIGAGSGIEGRLAHNRRAVGQDGKVFMPGRAWREPLGPIGIRYLEGPIDPEVGVLAVRTESLHLLSLLVNYTCHPVHVFPKLLVSADWPGSLAAALTARYGDACIPLALNGCCGNINPWPPYDPDYVEDHVLMGEQLATMTSKVVETLSFTGEAQLDWRVTHVRLPIREVEPEKLEEARRILEKDPLPPWADESRRRVRFDWMRAASTLSVDLIRRREGAINYEIQAFRIGDTAFVGLPGEPFVEGQLRLKLASPTPHTQVVHCTTQYVGYLPTREAFPRGGHEVDTSYWAKVMPDALDRVVDAAGGLLEQLFATES